MAAGKLFVVATPIGNLDDLTPRAIAVLREVDLIAAEDTRHSKPLLEKFAIQTSLRSYHDFSDQSVSDSLLVRLQEGQSLALISDAGTPLISDPGYRLVRQLREAGVDVIPVPGVSALTAALSVAGLPTDRFCFEGFLPAKSGARVNTLADLVFEQRTLVFYESPHRMLDTLQDMGTVFGPDRPIFIAREMTKKFETHFHGSISGALDWIASDANNLKGEFVLVVQGCDENEHQQQLLRQALPLVQELQADLSMKKAVALVSRLTGVRKNTLYQAVLEASQD